MKIFYNSTSKTGYCDCDCFPNNNTTETFCFKDKPYFEPPYAFSAGRCYQLLSQVVYVYYIHCVAIWPVAKLQKWQILLTKIYVLMNYRDLAKLMSGL